MGKLFKREDSKKWQMIYQYRGTTVRRSTGTADKRKALKILHQHEAVADRGVKLHDYSKTCFNDLVKHLLRDQEEKENKTIAKVERNLEYLKTFFGNMPVIDINKKLIQNYKKKRLKDGLAKGSINRELATLRRGFYALREDDMIPAVPKVKLYAEKNARQRYLTKDEYNRFLTSLEDLGFYYLVPVVELAVKTGWRKETILNIQWQHVKREDEDIVLPYLLTKNGEAVTYPYDEDAVVKSRIEQLWKKRNNPVPYVFLNKDGTDRIRDFRFAWNKAVAEAKIGDGEGYGAGFQAGFKFHDLKRTNIVWNEEDGVSRSVTKEISGTKTDIIFDRYNIVDKKRMRKAIKNRQDLINEDKSKKGQSMVALWKESAVDQARETE